MKIAVINETSAADRNADILAALEGHGHTVLNVGMKKNGEKPELTYIHTGLLAALMLNTGAADLVVGGCGTGQGFLNSAMQYPGVFCGLISGPLDAWLFTQINGGNCVSLPLNQGYGWAADINLRFIFERLFSVERGSGYPPHRKESQAQSRDLLNEVNRQAHRPLGEILTRLPEAVLRPALDYPGVIDLLRSQVIKEEGLRQFIIGWK
ncbi:MAG TPA: RpiB/LacA/LacB family sugar-phosphate isomerase [Anaerolineaceae bacterium]|nr:RpiB/LacA/LacB family sugar-phosphate isomerase [Anaerolineaceae bacterium]